MPAARCLLVQRFRYETQLYLHQEARPVPKRTHDAGLVQSVCSAQMRQLDSYSRSQYINNVLMS